MTEDVLAGFTRTSFSHGGTARDVYRAGTGPAVILIHELPGLHPGVVTFAHRVIEAGLTAYLPVLLGTAGGAGSGGGGAGAPAPGRRPAGEPVSGGYVASTLARACVSREFTTFATGRTSPITGWLRALAAQAHEECGGPGVGAVGMCLTGGFALAMMVDERMLAPVLSQPSMPFAITSK